MRRRRATVQWRHLVNWHEAARCGEWAQHFSIASCCAKVVCATLSENYLAISVFHNNHPVQNKHYTDGTVQEINLKLYLSAT